MGLNGAKTLFKDSKVGILVGFVVAQAAMGVVEALGTIDFSTLPTWLSTSAALAVGALANAITAWALPRKAPAAGTGTTYDSSAV